MKNLELNEISENKKEKFTLSENARTLILCFFVPFLSMIFLYSIFQVWPIGNSSVLVLDLNAQYIYYFEELRDILTNGGSLLYSFNRALGGEFLGIFGYYLSSPFSLLILLFPKNMITEAIYLMLVLKTGFCGLTFGYLLQKKYTIRPVYRLIFSSLFALSSYVVVMQSNIMWMDNVLIFPIVLLAVDELITKKKFKLYVITLVYSIMSNFYIGYMTCLFILIWFFVRYFMLSPEEKNPNGDKFHFPKALFRIGVWSIVSVMISAIIIFPMYYSLTFGKLEFSTPNFTPKQMYEFADILTKTFFGSYDTISPSGMPFIYCGTLALILAPHYFFVRDIPTRRKIGYAVMMGILIISFNFSIADIIWHGMQRPNWLNARFAYMFVALLLLMAVEVINHLPAIGEKALKLTSVAWCVLLVILAKIGYDHLDDFLSVWPGIVLFIMFAAILPVIVRMEQSNDYDKAVAFGLCMLIVAEAIGNGAVMIYRMDDDVGIAKRTSYRQMVDTYTEAVDLIEDDSFHRTEKLVHRKKNDNFALDINGMSNSTSTLNARAIDLLAQLGYASMSHWSLYSGANPVTDAIFGIKYVMADETDDKAVMEYIHTMYDLIGSTDEKIDVYQNPYSLSIAYAADDDIISYDVPPEVIIDEETGEEIDQYDDYVDPFTYMNDMLSALIGEKVVVWTKCDINDTHYEDCDIVFVTGHRGYKDDGDGDGEVGFKLDIESTAPIYCYFPSDYPRDATLKLNGSKLGGFFDGENFSIRELGSFEIDDYVYVSLALEEKNLYLKNGCNFFYYFNEDVFTEAVAKLQKGTLSAFSERDDIITGTINVPADKEVVFTTIPYDKGWTILVDGKEAEPISVVNETLLAFNITPGEHEITMKYEPECVKYGLIVSSVGLFIFLVAYIIDAICKKKSPVQVVQTSAQQTTDDESVDQSSCTDTNTENSNTDEANND